MNRITVEESPDEQLDIEQGQFYLLPADESEDDGDRLVFVARIAHDRFAVIHMASGNRRSDFRTSLSEISAMLLAEDAVRVLTPISIIPG